MCQQPIKDVERAQGGRRSKQEKWRHGKQLSLWSYELSTLTEKNKITQNMDNFPLPVCLTVVSLPKSNQQINIFSVSADINQACVVVEGHTATCS